MTRPTFDMKISLGNVLSIGSVVVGLTMGYTTLRADGLETRRMVATIETSALQRESRLRAVEIQQAGQSSDLRSIQAGILEIKGLISSLNKSQP